MEEMRVKLQVATAEDVSDLVSLRAAANEHLTVQYGAGFWSSSRMTEKGALFAMRRSAVYVARNRGRLIATLALSTRKPWAIDTKYFSASARPLYLTSMEVVPDLQRTGVGRLCIDEVRRIAKKWPSDAVRLDAWNAAAGAGEFYRKCGFREVGRASYRNAPLIYFEMLL
jgi:GNAT superfamily N-acetyltransferase